ncbi:hypothetical protein F5Y04DRAFT_155011 [Hypomontagnella monticulosa]|nr:hypothetical protein F5Y04DRAFT_155011 [Hypomontagnella monticulosa]
MSNKYHDQPGLEVAPEPELPQVVQGPTIIEKPYDGTTQYGFEQQAPPHQGTFHENNAYPNGQYPSAGYPPPLYPAPASQGPSYWRSSQDGTYVTDRFPPSSNPPNHMMILGLRRRTFWFIFGPLIALLVLGLAIGLGVGLSRSHDDSNSSSSAASSTPSATAAPTPLACPKANGTTYQGTNNEKFLVLCNVDYNGNFAGSGTTDIGNEETSTVEDCITVCAGNTSCVGAGWGNINGNDICYLKGSLGKSQSAVNWFFAIKQQ